MNDPHASMADKKQACNPIASGLSCRDLVLQYPVSVYAPPLGIVEFGTFPGACVRTRRGEFPLPASSL